jgi:glycerol-3-phosphate acyltransferase PlsY
MPWLIAALGYLLGSIPSAYIAGRILKDADIRRMGDENAGAANAYRELSHRAGVIVGILDAAKGAAAVLIAQAAGLSQLFVLLAGLTAVIGHNWPVFLGFRGGRGVSTAIGVLLVLATLPMLALALPTLLILIWRKNVTPAMAFLFIMLPLAGWWFGVAPLIIGYGVALPVLVGLTTLFRTRLRPLRQA